MKLFKRFFALFLFVAPTVSGAQVATTASGSLTAWNGNVGANNNNTWNSLMNNRATGASGGAAPKADFGNCNSLILRCAQPKCSACSSMDIARPIVEGCVNSNDSCKKHGADLVDFISAQIVANAQSKLQEQQLAMQQAATQQAAMQNNAQIQQMQQQMQNMQMQMQQQNQQQMQQMQAALDEQKALVQQARDEAARAQAEKIEAQTVQNSGITQIQQQAIDNGASSDLLYRQQISGEILSKIENAEQQLKNLKTTMDDAFNYAGCDSRGNNCAGPKRVKMFKEKAELFFEPYDAIIDEVYDALETAMAVGVDVSDVLMMLNGACNKWGKYMCSAGSMKSSEGVTIGGDDNKHNPVSYTKNSCVGGKSQKGVDFAKGTSTSCVVGQTIPPEDDVRCQPIGLIAEDETVERVWLDEYGGDKMIRLGCLSSALDSITAFGRRKNSRGKTLDLDTLYRMIEQDALDHAGTNKFYSNSGKDVQFERVKYCNTTPVGYKRLVNAVNTKKLPNKICVPDDSLYKTAYTNGYISSDDATYMVPYATYLQDASNETFCNNNKQFVPSSCGLDWTTKAGDTSKKCYVTGDCVVYDGKVMTRAEADKKSGRKGTSSVTGGQVNKDKVSPTVAKNELNLYTLYMSTGGYENKNYYTHEACTNMGGTWLFSYEKCFCDYEWDEDGYCPEERE